ncbi:MAG: class I SAM-dependent methyltransferase [candidate division Zixibacteria bacterium]|nr:class I SAM-dependent methyltransferase [candidate division Zixibacteria bacterium]
MSSDGNYDSSPILAELYDLIPMHTHRPDRDFYVEEAKVGGGTVLELGCGTGRILLPIAASGCGIVGLDLSEHMLTRCRGKLESTPTDVRARVQLIAGSMTAISLDQSFHLVIVPFRAFQHLQSVDDQLACLRGAHRHLEPGGRLIVDLFHPDLKKLSSWDPSVEIEDCAEMTLPDGRRLRRCHRISAAHVAEQFNDVELIYYLTGANGISERIVHAFPVRYLFRYEMEHLLARSGFHLEHIFGNFDRSPLTDQSPEMIFVAKKN